jgi:hypothetical protein
MDLKNPKVPEYHVVGPSDGSFVYSYRVMHTILLDAGVHVYTLQRPRYTTPQHNTHTEAYETVIDDESIQAFEPVEVTTWAFWVATLLMVIMPFVLIFID